MKKIETVFLTTPVYEVYFELLTTYCVGHLCLFLPRAVPNSTPSPMAFKSLQEKLFQTK